jgi:hypothetical protein
MRIARNMAGIGALGCLPLLAACGDPVPPAPQANVSIQVAEYDPMDPVNGNKRCPPYRHWLNVPYQRDKAPSSQSQQASDSNADVRAINGQEGNKVSCKVTPDGSNFKVTASATGYAQNMDRKLSPVSVNISIPSIGEGDSSARGRFTFQDDTTAGNQYYSDDCTYSVEGGAMGVKPGGIWGKISCEGVKEDKTPDSACVIQNGFFVFENCNQ